MPIRKEASAMCHIFNCEKTNAYEIKLRKTVFYNAERWFIERIIAIIALIWQCERNMIKKFERHKK